MAIRFWDGLRGLFLLFWLNLRHYALAIWGLRLRLDPDYPGETRFRGDLVVDAVLEYRGYGLLAPWSVFLAGLAYPPSLELIAALWAVSAWRRAYFYSTPYRFWTQAYDEAPGKSRNQTRYAEELMLEIERKMKAGMAYDHPEMQFLVGRSIEIQNLICGKPFKMPEGL